MQCNNNIYIFILLLLLLFPPPITTTSVAQKSFTIFKLKNFWINYFDCIYFDLWTQKNNNLEKQKWKEKQLYEYVAYGPERVL